MAKATTVADYIAEMPPVARRALKQLRTAIKAAAPGITERISYRIPTFELDGRYLLYIAAFKEHVSVYPVTPGMLAGYGKAIAPYRAGKGTLRFPLSEPIPTDLVAKLAKVRVRERRESARRSGSRSVLLVPLLLLSAACGDSLGPACLPVVRPAVEVEVRDAHTAEFRADSARGVVHDGAYTDSLAIVRYYGPHIVPAALGAAYERPGTYSIRIEREGYTPWDTVGVRVRADRCGAAPVQVVARLSPTP